MSYCPMCGVQNPEGVAFCYQCGQSMTMPRVKPCVLPAAANILSVISMVCGIVSCCASVAGFIFSIPALILAALSRGKTPAGVDNGKARAGMITGIIGIVLSVLWFIILVSIYGL